MSYDLSFRAESDPTPDAVRAWFAARDHYEVTGDQASYFNRDSGVYFSYYLGGSGEDGLLPVAFNINYFRPAYFGLEAEPELTAFVEAFGLSVSDPQSDGMGDGAYSSEGFLRGWNAGNTFGYRAMAAHGGGEVARLPAAINTGVWRWNRMREAYVDLLGSIEMVCGFAPTVYRLVREGEARVYTAAIWGEGMEIAMPEVDLVLAMTTPGDAPRVIPLASLRGLLEGSPVREADHRFDLDGRQWEVGLRHWLVDPVSPALKQRLAREGEPWPLQGVSADLVLDAELLASA